MLTQILSVSSYFLCLELEWQALMYIFYEPCWHRYRQFTYSIQHVISSVKGVISEEKIITVILSTYHVPKARCREAVVGIHFILKACFITINFFKEINYFYVGLYLIILFYCVCSLFSPG